MGAWRSPGDECLLLLPERETVATGWITVTERDCGALGTGLLKKEERSSWLSKVAKSSLSLS